MSLSIYLFLSQHLSHWFSLFLQVHSGVRHLCLTIFYCFSRTSVQSKMNVVLLPKFNFPIKYLSIYFYLTSVYLSLNNPSLTISSNTLMCTFRDVERQLLLVFQTSIILNPLWPSDAIWWQGTGSALAQVMVCCLTAPSNYLNQCWLMITDVQWQCLVHQLITLATKLLFKDAIQISQWPIV